LFQPDSSTLEKFGRVRKKSLLGSFVLAFFKGSLKAFSRAAPPGTPSLENNFPFRLFWQAACMGEPHV
jgi:hypothetical protein